MSDSSNRPLPSLDADVLVVGFGKAGKTLAATLGRLGRRVVMVEQSAGMYGGTCINIGCVPTKALVHAANERHDGVGDDEWFAAATGSMRELTDLLRGRNFAMLDAIEHVTVITGRARFVGPRTVEVSAGADRLRIAAEHVVVNTGAVPVMPDVPGLRESARVVTSTELLAATERPRRLVVLGGGFLGLEFAQMFRAFGSEVTVLESADRLLPHEDDDVALALADVLAGDGVTVVTGARATSVADLADGARVAYAVGDDEHAVDADAVLVATGRRPATDDLGLEAAGIEVTDRGAIRVDEFLRTSAPNVFAVGDVNGGPQFTYISLDDHRIVLDRLTGDGTRSTLDRVAIPTTAFVTPPLSRVGLTERAAEAAGHRVVVAAKPVAQIAAMPRARIVGDPRGLVKFVVDADTGLVLGATLFCVDSQEAINTVALAMRHRIPAAVLRDGVYTHPSATEAFNEVLAGVALPRGTSGAA